MWFGVTKDWDDFDIDWLADPPEPPAGAAPSVTVLYDSKCGVSMATWTTIGPLDASGRRVAFADIEDESYDPSAARRELLAAMRVVRDDGGVEGTIAAAYEAVGLDGALARWYGRYKGLGRVKSWASTSERGATASAIIWIELASYRHARPHWHTVSVSCCSAAPASHHDAQPMMTFRPFAARVAGPRIRPPVCYSLLGTQGLNLYRSRERAARRRRARSSSDDREPHRYLRHRSAARRLDRLPGPRRPGRGCRLEPVLRRGDHRPPPSRRARRPTARLATGDDCFTSGPQARRSPTSLVEDATSAQIHRARAGRLAQGACADAVTACPHGGYERPKDWDELLPGARAGIAGLATVIAVRRRSWIGLAFCRSGENDWAKRGSVSDA